MAGARRHRTRLCAISLPVVFRFVASGVAFRRLRQRAGFNRLWTMIDLYTSEAPNVCKISIALSKNEQKQDWYLKTNPNGRKFRAWRAACPRPQSFTPYARSVSGVLSGMASAACTAGRAFIRASQSMARGVSLPFICSGISRGMAATIE